MNKKTADFTEGSVTKGLFRYALPFILSNAVQIIYPVIDMALTGKRFGTEALAAVSAAGQLMSLLTMLGVGFCAGGQICFSSLCKEDERKSLPEAARTFFFITLLLSAAVTVPGLLCSGKLLQLISPQAGPSAAAREYFVISGFSLVFIYAYNAVSALFRGLADSKTPLVFIAASAAVKLLCDVLLVRVFSFGVRGAAVSTLAAHFSAFICSVLFVRRKKEETGIGLSVFRPGISAEHLKKLLKLGLPLAARSGAVNLSMLVTTRLVSSLSVDFSAAFAVGIRADDMLCRLSQGVTYAASSFIAQNNARQKNQRVRRSVRASWLFCLVLYLAAAVWLIAFPKSVFALFSKEEAVLSYAPLFALTFLPSFPAMIVMRGTNAYLQGTGKTGLCFLIALLDGVIFRIGLCFLLGRTAALGETGYFLGYALSAYAGAIPGSIYYYYSIRR